MVLIFISVIMFANHVSVSSFGIFGGFGIGVLGNVSPAVIGLVVLFISAIAYAAKPNKLTKYIFFVLIAVVILATILSLRIVVHRMSVLSLVLMFLPAVGGFVLLIKSVSIGEKKDK